MEVLLHISLVRPQTQTFYHCLQICCMTSYLHFINLITHLVFLMVQQVIYIFTSFIIFTVYTGQPCFCLSPHSPTLFIVPIRFTNQPFLASDLRLTFIFPLTYYL